MKKVLLLAVMALFVGAGAANACDGHAKAKTTKASTDKVCAPSTATTATGAKKDCTDAAKASCATKTAGKATPDCCASKKGAKMTEGATKTTTTQAKL